MDQIVKQWFLRNIPLTGKVLLVNTLMSSLFIHQMMVLPPLSSNQLHKIDSIITKFLWKGRKSKIPLAVLCRLKNQGGLKLCDFEIKYYSLQIHWVKKAMDNDKFSYVNDLLTREMGVKIWTCNLSEKDAECFLCEFPFWKEIRKWWAKINYYKPTTTEEVKEQTIWYNSFI